MGVSVMRRPRKNRCELPLGKITDRVCRMRYITDSLHMSVSEVTALLRKHNFSPQKIQKRVYIPVDIIGYVLRKEINNITKVNRNVIVALINEFRTESEAFQAKYGTPTMNAQLWNSESEAVNVMKLM